MSLSWAAGSSRAWRRIRALVLAWNAATNEGRCTLQLPGVCTGDADQVHHRYGRALTGDDPRYLDPACGPCNRKVGDPLANDPQPRPLTNW